MQKSTFFPEIKTGWRVNSICLLILLSQGTGHCQEEQSLPAWGDVVITEIMADPSPPLKWEEEYIELFNRSKRILDLQDWKLKVGDRSVNFPTESFADSLFPGDYRVLVISSLPNEGSCIQVLDSRGWLVHAVEYRSPPFAPGWKKEGGWSLESPDPDLVCGVSGHWSYSCNPSGGTPGAPNCYSLEVDDLSSPVFLYHGFSRSGELYLQFSESLFLADGTESSIRIRPGDCRPILVHPSVPFRDRLYLMLPPECRGGDRFRISLPPLYDCSGNQGQYPEICAGRAEAPLPGSIMLSEIMFSPGEGKNEFIEIFNPGPDFVDLHDLVVGLAMEGELPESFCVLSDHSRIMCPGQYVVLCKRSDEMMLAYGLTIEGAWAEVEGFPALPDGGGEVVLADRAGNTLDRAPFNDGMHLAFLGDHRGFSLERMNFGLAASNPDNWHSAASTAAGATPGRENSQYIVNREAGSKLIIEPKVFSPDNDGFEDVLRIGLQAGEPGTVIRLWVSSPEGRMIRILADGELSGKNSHYTWDGRNEHDYQQEEGFYVIHLHVLNSQTGKLEQRREVCGLVYR